MKKISLLLLVLLFIVSGCGNYEENSKDENHQDVANEEFIDAKANSSDDTDSDVSDNQNDQISDNPNESDTDSTDQPVTSRHQEDSSPPLRDLDRKLDLNATEIVVGSMEPSIQYEINGGNVLLIFKVKNQTKHPFTFHFDSSQRFEYIIQDGQGTIVEQYSKNTKFMEMPGEEPVKPGGYLEYKVTIENLPKGSYPVLFILTAKEMKLKTSTTFEVK